MPQRLHYAPTRYTESEGGEVPVGETHGLTPITGMAWESVEGFQHFCSVSPKNAL